MTFEEWLRDNDIIEGSEDAGLAEAAWLAAQRAQSERTNKFEEALKAAEAKIDFWLHNFTSGSDLLYEALAAIRQALGRHTLLDAALEEQREALVLAESAVRHHKDCQRHPTRAMWDKKCGCGADMALAAIRYALRKARPVGPLCACGLVSLPTTGVESGADGKWHGRLSCSSNRDQAHSF